MTESYHLIEISKKMETIEFNPLFDKKIKPESASIDTLLKINNLKDVIEPFYTFTGLGVAIFSAQHDILLKQGWQKICTNFHKKNEKASKSCFESETFFQNNYQPNQVLSYKCSNGLWDIAYPFYINGVFVGSIHFGQCFFDDDEIDKSFFIQQANKFKFDEYQYISTLKEVPIFNYKKVLAGIELLIKVIEKMIK
jgi:ligand-binding sensor protein